MLNLLKNFHQEESGQDLIEYALLAALIALGAVTMMGNVATAINAQFSKVVVQLNAA
jgi:pilus assembly protein Flp/PilA